MDEEEKQGLIMDSKSLRYQRQKRSSFQKIVTVFNVFLLILSLLILLQSKRNYSVQNTLNYDLKQVNTFSPIFEQLPLALHDTTVNGSLFNDPQIIWRQEPSPAVDAAWDRLATIKWFPISSSDVKKLGKDPSKTAQVPENWGYGTNHHLAALDSQHLLHCLNGLRKHSHAAYYFPNSTHPSLWQSMHSSHCIYLLLQALTCQPSLNVITHNWVEGQKHPFPDFGIERKCVDYDAVWEWNMEKGMDMDLVKEHRRPEGEWLGPRPMGYDAFKELERMGGGITD